MRAAAKIEYVGKFGEGAPGAAPAAPATTAPAAPAPAASGGLNATDISKGMGLK